jgi:hypothetical protein
MTTLTPIERHLAFAEAERQRQRDLPGAGWQARSARGLVDFPVPIDVALVADLLSVEQRHTWDAYLARLDQLAAARTEAGRLAVLVAAAENDDLAAARAAVETGESVPASVRPGRVADHDTALRYVHALEGVATDELEALRLALVPAWPTMLAKAWTDVAELKPKQRTPEALRRGIARVEWAMGLTESPALGGSDALAVLDALPMVAWEGHVDELLDGLGQRVAATLAHEQAEAGT